MSRGHDRERAVRRVLEADGWWTCRAAGSLGDADVVAMSAMAPSRLIEVKSTAGGAYERFVPAKRRALSAAAARAGAEAWLAWWPPHGKLYWIEEDKWPVDPASLAEAQSEPTGQPPFGEGILIAESEDPDDGNTRAADEKWDYDSRLTDLDR